MTTDPKATNEGALALYNFDNRTNLDTFETVPLNTVLLYRDKAAAVIRAYSASAQTKLGKELA